MAKSDFIPKRDGDLDAYEENFVNKLTTHSEALGLDQTVVIELTGGINEHRQAFTKMISKKAESKSATENNLAKKSKALYDLRRGAKIIKSLKNYTPAIGDDLQIIGSLRPVTDFTRVKPVLSHKVNAQIAYIKFKKDGTNGIRLFSKRGNETEFTMLDHSSISPYADNRPKLSNQPETREYYAVFIIDMNEVGLVSDSIKVTIP